MVQLTEEAATRLTPRWTRLNPHPEQSRLWTSRVRFRTVHAGRRSGKTELAKRYLIKCALEFHETHPHVTNGRFIFCAPTYSQVREIYWEDVKQLIPKWALLKEPHETRLEAVLINGVRIQLYGMEKPQRVEGAPIDGAVVDEIGDMKPSAWFRHLKPAMDTEGRAGWVWFIGKPVGRNHYWRMVQHAQDSANEEWDDFSWFSADILSPSLIEEARRVLDPVTYKMEYEGSFESYEGKVYWPFERTVHAAEKLHYEPSKPLEFSFDYNVTPGTAGYGQEQMYRGRNQQVCRSEPITMTLGEVWIENGSNTRRVCHELMDRWSEHEGLVYCYGDPAGGARATSQVEGSDWDIVRKEFSKMPKWRVRYRVAKAHPAQRARINSVNARLLGHDGLVRWLIDCVDCPNTIDDFEGVVGNEKGEIDKNYDMMLTHLTDGYGYLIHEKHPAVDRFTRVETIL